MKSTTKKKKKNPKRTRRLAYWIATNSFEFRWSIQHSQAGFDPLFAEGAEFTEWKTDPSTNQATTAGLDHTFIKSQKNAIDKIKFPFSFLIIFKDNCHGDSGGPLWMWIGKENSKATIVGVVSRGEGCARQDLPGIYTRVEKFLPWIHKHSQCGHCWLRKFHDSFLQKNN